MNKPKPEDFGCINNTFPTETDRLRYEFAKKQYLSWKRKNNKEKLVEKVVEMIKDDPYNYKEVISDCLYESFSKCTQVELKTWL